MPISHPSSSYYRPATCYGACCTEHCHALPPASFNNAQTAPDGLWAGSTSLTRDFSTQVYRQRLLGFNSVRLPFSFRDFRLRGRTDYHSCTPASQDAIRRSVTPPGLDPYAWPLPQPRIPLTVSANGRCNVGMPDDVFDRLLWVINYYARSGFVVVIDNHVRLVASFASAVLCVPRIGI